MSNNCEKKLVRSKSGLRIVPTNDNFRSPFELSEPAWIPDKESPTCTECKVKFDLMTRRHHCRRCGRVYCKSCSDTKISLPRMCFVDPVRHCDECAQITGKENEFYDRHLKILTTGASFTIQSSLLEDTDDIVFYCKLSSDHRNLLFDSQSTLKHAPVEIAKIISIKFISGADALQGSLDVQFLDRNHERAELKLSTPDSEKTQSRKWITAFQRAFLLAVESREPSARLD